MGAFREGCGPHPVEHLERGTQLGPGVAPAPVAAQPLAVHEMGAAQIDPQAGAPEVVDRRDVEIFGAVARDSLKFSRF